MRLAGNRDIACCFRMICYDPAQHVHGNIEVSANLNSAAIRLQIESVVLCEGSDGFKAQDWEIAVVWKNGAAVESQQARRLHRQDSGCQDGDPLQRGVEVHGLGLRGGLYPGSRPLDHEGRKDGTVCQ